MTDSTSNGVSPRIKLVAVFSVFAVPFIIATVWFNQIKSTSGSVESKANGKLVAPARPLEAFEQAALEGATVNSLADLKDQWTLLYFNDGDCNEVCAKTLYDSRQVRISLGREMHRVKRLMVGDTPLTPELRELHLQLQTSGADQSEQGLKAQVRGHVGAEIFDADPEQLYLIDPLGNLMMRFPSELPQKLFLKDLKVLLKASRIG
ncbi:MAG: SCO family protein [Granulosicoccaceae bacterium]